MMDEHPSATECYIYNFSRDGIAEGKKSLIPAFCDLCGLKYTGSNAFTYILIEEINGFLHRYFLIWGY